MCRTTGMGNWGWLMVLVVVSLAGCGPGSGGRLPLSGKVTLKGQPLANGTIEFTSADQTQMSGGVITNGEYKIDAVQGLPPGDYTVRIHSASETATSASEPPGTDSLQPPAKELIPDEYNVMSTIKAKVSDGQPNVFNYDIP